MLIRYLAASQLQSIDARKVFPCLDEPDLKASFSVAITHSPGKCKSHCVSGKETGGVGVCVCGGGGVSARVSCYITSAKRGWGEGGRRLVVGLLPFPPCCQVDSSQGRGQLCERILYVPFVGQSSTLVPTRRTSKAAQFAALLEGELDNLSADRADQKVNSSVCLSYKWRLVTKQKQLCCMNSAGLYVYTARTY